MIAAATPLDYRVRLHDENLGRGDAPRWPAPEVVGISVHTAFAPRAYALADRYRQAGSRVVLGGLHVSALPEEARPHADAVVLGDGVAVWPRVLEGLRSGSLRDGAVVRGSFVTPHVREQPWARRDVLPAGAFLTTGAVIATRGCTNRCAYCYLATRGVRAPHQQRPVEDVLAEIDAIGEPYVVFTDNNLMADVDYGLALCRGLERRRLIWSAAVTADVARSPTLVAAMGRSGCQGVFVGLETLDDANLKAQRKRTLRPSRYRRAVRLLHDHGVQVNGSFVFGFDGDDPEVFDRTLDFIVSERLECATFHILTPYPGTPLFRQLEAQGRLLTRDWRRYDTAHVVFQPARMSPEQLLRGYRRVYRQLYDWSTIYARRPGAVSAGLSSGGLCALPLAAARTASYLAMTLLYKKQDWLWRALVPLRLTHAAWRPLVALHRALAWRAPRHECGTVDASSSSRSSSVSLPLARAA